MSTVITPDDSFLANVAEAKDDINRAEEELEDARRRFKKVVWEANKNHGLSQKVIGDRVGLSKQRISELILQLEGDR